MRSETDAIGRMLASRRIVIVGLSDDPSRTSHAIGAYLQQQGYEIVGVNPNVAQTLGARCYPSLADVPGKVELVNVFRRPDFCAEVAREAVACGASGLWLQSGIVSAAARRIAEEAGMDYVESRCIMVEHAGRGLW